MVGLQWLFLVLRYTLLPSLPFGLPDNRSIPRFLSCSNVLFSIFKVPSYSDTNIESSLIARSKIKSSWGSYPSRRRTSTIPPGLQGTLRDDLNDLVYREVYNFVLDSLSIMKVFVVSQTQETSIYIFNGLNLLDARKVLNSTSRQSQGTCLELPLPSLRSLPFPTPKVCTSGRA